MRRSGNRISLNPQKNHSQIFFSFDNGNGNLRNLNWDLDWVFQQSVDHRPDNLSPKFREVDVMGQIAVFPDVTLGVEDWF